MPNRYVREGILDSESVNSLSVFAQNMYFRLIFVVDDAGRFDGRESLIATNAFPTKPDIRLKDVSESLADIRQAGLLIAYQYNNKPFIQLTKWQRYGNSITSKYPWKDGSFDLWFVKLKTKDGQKEFVSTSIEGAPGFDEKQKVGNENTPSRPHPYPTPIPKGGGCIPISKGSINDNDKRNTLTNNDNEKDLFKKRSLIVTKKDIPAIDSSKDFVSFGKNKAGQERRITRKFWDTIVKKYGSYEAALYCYRAKDAENIEAYITDGVLNKYIFVACKDEDKNPKAVKAWVEKLQLENG